MKTVAIMQPTYLPWLGYFAMMGQVDAFVFLDSVQFEKRSWHQRNRIKTASGAQWLTVPVLTKGAFHQSIEDARIDTEHFSCGEKHISAMRHAYGRAPHFQRYSADLFAILAAGQQRLADLTIDLTCYLAGQLGLSTPVIRASSMHNEGNKAERLANLCVALGAKRYLAAPGSADYLAESDAFAAAGVEVVFNTYQHPVYPQQHGDFLAYMSAVDLLFNVGPDSPDILRQGYHTTAAADMPLPSRTD